MRRIFLLLTPVVIYFFSISSAYSEIVVVSVKGHVAYKTALEWRSPLEPGMTLQEGVKISTGVKSSAVIRINKHMVTIKPLTMVKIYKNSIKKQEETTLIGLRRGTIRAKVYHEKVKNKRITIFKVSTPVATSSVRGTEEIISYGPGKGMRIFVVEGNVAGENVNGAKRHLMGRLVFHQKPEKSEPEPLLARVKEESIADLQFKNVSDDERSGFEYQGDDYTFGIGRTGGVDEGMFSVSTGGSSGRSSTLVNLHLMWPR